MGSEEVQALVAQLQHAPHTKAVANPLKMPANAGLVARDGKILFEKAYGMADVEHKIRANAQTKFRIGSITKQFVASAIMLLVEQGKIGLDDSIGKYFPEAPVAWEGVTIRRLLTLRQAHPTCPAQQKRLFGPKEVWITIATTRKTN